MTTSYAETVVHPGDMASKLAAKVCRSSRANNCALLVREPSPDGFRDQVDFTLNDHLRRAFSDGYFRFDVQNDGAGGKPSFAGILGTEEAFEHLGHEVIAMTADDLARSGALPVQFANQVDARLITSENIHLFEALMRGLESGLEHAHLVCTTGETAIMKRSITGFGDDGGVDSLWMTHSGSCLGLVHHQMQRFPKRFIRPGMPIVGLGEQGYRCNGGTQFITIIEKLWGSTRKKILQSSTAHEFITKLATPSVIYTPWFLHALGWKPESGQIRSIESGIVGAAHITGGGIWEKLADILPHGVGAELDLMPAPPEVLLQARVLADEAEMPMTDHECYGTFHGGCGMLVVCEDMASATRFMHNMSTAGFPRHLALQVVGKTVESASSEILIESRFQRGGTLSSLQLS